MINSILILSLISIPLSIMAITTARALEQWNLQNPLTRFLARLYLDKKTYSEVSSQGVSKLPKGFRFQVRLLVFTGVLGLIFSPIGLVTFFVFVVFK